MAETNPLNAKVGKTYPGIINRIDVAPIRLTTQDISNWKDAINSARDVKMPRRRKLIELFDNIRMDGKVVTVIEKRKASLTNKSIVFNKKGKDGKPVERIHEEVIEQSWFSDMLEAIEEIEEFYGHLCFEFIPGSELPIETIKVIPPSNISPEYGLILPNYMDPFNGIKFRGADADPFCKKYVMEFGKTHNYGLLMPIAQYVIYKRGGFGDWAQFAELFGMPFRVGKYNAMDQKSRQLLTQALREMGGAGFAVIPEGTSLDFMQSNYGSGQSGIFKDLIGVCNDEIAQIALGGTLTTDNAQSRAASETHKEGEQDLQASRLKKILKFLNGPFKKRLVEQFGYTEAADGHFCIDNPERISLDKRIAIDTQLNNIVEIAPEYFYEKYNVPAPASGPAKKEKPQEAPTDPAKGQKKNSKLSAKLAAYYKTNICGKCSGFKLAAGGTPPPTPTPIDDKELNRLAKLLFNKKGGNVDKKLLKRIAGHLMSGISNGYLRTPGSDAFTQKDAEMLAQLRENIFVFSGFKTEKMLKEASAALVDETGTLRSFAEFKEALRQIDHTYNMVYAVPEYEHAVASSQMASKWVGFQQTAADFPNLIYRTAGDDRVRDVHALLDGTVRPINDGFWDENYPPNGWGCRCDADATDQTVTTNKVVRAADSPMFAHNVGKDGVVFPKNHPYYEASEQTRRKVIETVNQVM